MLQHHETERFARGQPGMTLGWLGEPFEQLADLADQGIGGLATLGCAALSILAAQRLERMASLSGGQHPPEFASTHPNPANRIQHLQSLMPQAQAFRAKYCQQGAATASR